MKGEGSAPGGSRRAEREAFHRFAAEDSPAGGEGFDAAVPELDRQIKKYLLFYGAKGEHLDDLAQEALVRVYVNRARLRGQGEAAVKAWLRIVCRNLRIDTQRLLRTQEARTGQPGCKQAGARQEAAPRRRLQEPAPPDEIPALEADPALKEILDMCIGSLPDRNRAMFEQRYLLALATSEIAELFDKGVRLIQSELKRARELVADCLRNHGYAVEN